MVQRRTLLEPNILLVTTAGWILINTSSETTKKYIYLWGKMKIGSFIFKNIGHGPKNVD